MFCFPVITQLNSLTGTAGMDSVHNNEPINFDVAGINADSTVEKNEPVSENHRETDSIRGNFNYSEEWYWFIGINIYPNELKNN